VQHSFISDIEGVIQLKKQQRMHFWFATATLGMQNNQNFTLYVRRIYC